MNTAAQSIEERFADAISEANIPTLLMVLVQLTGDLRWLEFPYLPTKARGLSDNDTGGLSDDVQSDIRRAALDAILAWHRGAPVALPSPSSELLIRMMGVAMGEAIPDEYAPMIAAELGLENDDVFGCPIPEDFRVLIIGAGISGICAAVRLQAAGVPFTIIERNLDVGGVWLENRYPGAAVDTPSHLYSFSFAPYDWPQYFSTQPQILEYLRWVADRFDLRRHVVFGTEVKSVTYNESNHEWYVETSGPAGQSTVTANVVVSAVGAFNKPKLPTIDGMDSFTGLQFHTATWPEGVDLTGRRVAVVGNGASAMQVVPAIVDSVGSMVVFQHSPQWVAPFEKFKQTVPDAVRTLLEEMPLYYAWYRCRLAWIFNDRLYQSLQKDPTWPNPEQSLNPINDAHRRSLTNYIKTELGDRTDLLDAVLPTYPPFGKRMLLDNGWFRAIAREHVTVETERITEVRPNSIVTSAGTEHEVDVIVWATGFDVVRFLAPIDIRGRAGTRLHDTWQDDDARAYLGTAVPGFPNFFVLYGPNTQFGHGGSLITVMERQVHYLMSALRRMFRDDLAAIEVRADVHDNYNAKIDATHERMVWTHPGMDTYYRNARGRVVVNNPFRMQEFWKFTESLDPKDYVLEPNQSR